MNDKSDDHFFTWHYVKHDGLTFKEYITKNIDAIEYLSQGFEGYKNCDETQKREQLQIFWATDRIKRLIIKEIKKY